jgi:hypothetical protein
MRRRSLAFIAVLCVGVACRSVPIHPRPVLGAEQQLSEAFRVALAFITEKRGAVVVVLPAAMNERTRRAIGAVCNTVERKDVQDTKVFSPPSGYFLVEYAVIEGRLARVAGVLGPVPKPRPGVVMLACGTGYYIDLSIDGTSWKITNVMLREC